MLSPIFVHLYISMSSQSCHIKRDPRLSSERSHNILVIVEIYKNSNNVLVIFVSFPYELSESPDFLNKFSVIKSRFKLLQMLSFIIDWKCNLKKICFFHLFI